MGLERKAFQGISNIVRFNWHFYVIAAALSVVLLAITALLPPLLHPLIWLAIVLILLPLVISLLISYYVYDLSDLYQLNWLPSSDNKKVLTVNAGFDESSEIVKDKYPKTELAICDFYDPLKHTEVSIKRAREKYPPLKDTIQVSTDSLPFEDGYFDYSIAILSAHEIRDEQERINFFKELNRITKENGQIFVTEHLRDFNNFMAYTIGVLHFHSKSTWMKTFKESNLMVKQEVKSTPFITTFVLEKNGDTV